MTYRTPEKVGNSWRKTKEIFGDIGYDISLASHQLRNGIHKGIFNRRLTKLKEISDQVWENADSPETTWHDGDTTISCALYEGTETWRLRKEESGVLIQDARISMRDQESPFVVSHLYNPDGSVKSTTVAIGGDNHDYKNLSAVVKDMLESIGSAERLAQLREGTR